MPEPTEGLNRLDPEHDVAAVQRDLMLTRPAAVTVLGAGVMHFANLAQIVLFDLPPWFWVRFAELGFLGLGLVAFRGGALFYDGHPSGARLGLVAGLGGAVFSAWWTLWLLFHTGLSASAFVGGAASALAGLACLIVGPVTARIERARRASA